MLTPLQESISQYIRSLYPGKPTSTEMGDGFCRWCLQKVFELTSDEAEEAMEISGPGDNGIDAFFEKDDHIRGVQAKFGKAHSYEAVAGFLHNCSRLLDGQVIGGRQAVLEAAVALQDGRAAGKRISFTYITSSTIGPNDRNRIKHLLKDKPWVRVWDLPEIHRILQERITDLPEWFKLKEFHLSLDQEPLEVKPLQTLLMPVPLPELARFVQEATQVLFASNVRNYLARTAINRGMETTLKTDPDKFWYYNNGLTIVCADYTAKGRSVTLSVPQVVNGCQTAKTIETFIRAHQLTAGHVLVRAIKGVSPEETTNITKYTNNQNAVKGKDFLALDVFQKTIQASVKELGYYYEIQRGAFDMLPRELRRSFGGNLQWNYLTPKSLLLNIPAQEAVQGYVSGFLKQPHVAYGRPSDVMPLGDMYKDVFNDETPGDPEYFLLPALVSSYATQALGYGHGGSGFRRYGRWLFVCCYFLTLLRLACDMGVVEKRLEDPRQLSRRLLQAVFNSQEFNGSLLEAADTILDWFFRDSATKALVKDDKDYRNFMKATCGKQQVMDLLQEKVDDYLAGREGRALKDGFRRAGV